MVERRRDREPALGSDPFGTSDGTLPYLIKLRENSQREVPEARPRDPARAEPERAPPDLGPEISALSFEDDDPVGNWLDAAAGLLINRDEEQRLARVASALGAHPYDGLGYSPRAMRRALAFFKLLYRYYFRVESRGHASIPEKGAAIIVANHGGLLPFDAAMAIVDLLVRGEPPRLLRSIVDRWAGSLPFVNIFYSRVGQVVGTRENLRTLLRNEQLVLIFPEGMAAIRKLAAQRYVLRPFNLGFVEASLRHRTPIIPTAIFGAEDQAPVLYDLRSVARLLGLPAFPITPTFPWLGPAGLLPYPVKYEIQYGEPMHLYDEVPRGSRPDPALLRNLADHVQGRIQHMLDNGLAKRRGRGG